MDEIEKQIKYILIDELYIPRDRWGDIKPNEGGSYGPGGINDAAKRIMEFLTENYTLKEIE